MGHRAARLALAMLLLVPVLPVRAADPVATDPAPTLAPAPDPSPQPTTAPEPTPAADPVTGPEPAQPAAAQPAADPAPADAADPGPAADPAPADAADPGAAAPLDAADRWIVVLRPGADLAAGKARARSLGVRADRTFSHATRGFSAKLSKAQVAALRADPGVAIVVPDAVVRVTSQLTPTGVRRIGGTKSPVAGINGVDVRVDADVAIVDTGIDRTHPDLNVVGGYNCSTTNHGAWQDENGHGTHVAGTVGAIDNGSGVVGVAPGVRLWAVRILNSEGSGLLSWYVCGLDWIAAQRDPSDPALPMFEAVNMSVAKSGSDDGNCGNTNKDILHQAICRLVASGVTVVAAAGNNSFNALNLVPASYNEVITVSALADTDGKPGGLGGNLCYSWGSYDKDDTFANFSNYGHDIDLIAPGKCIWSTLPGSKYGYSSGTSMAAPHVTGAVALYKASRPLATPADVKRALQTLGNLGWATSTDPDTYHEKLLDVSKIVPLGDFAVDAASPPAPVTELGATLQLPVTVIRSEDFIETVTLSASAPAGMRATFATSQLYGASGTSSTLTLTVPRGTPTGRYSVVVSGTNWDRVRTSTVTVVVEGDLPTAVPPLLAGAVGSTFNTTSFTARGVWAAATDPTSAIAGYQAQWSVDGGAWGSTVSLPASTRYVSRTLSVGHSYGLRVRARDSVGNWSPWAAASPFRAYVVQDTFTSLVRTGSWTRYRSSSMSGGSTLYATKGGSSISTTVSGRGFALVMPRGPTRGSVRVYVDGALVATVSTYHSSTQARRIVLSRIWSAGGSHTLRMVVVGTSGHPRVDLDAILVIK